MAWCYIPVIPALWKWRQEDWGFKDSLAYVVRLSQKRGEKSLVVVTHTCNPGYSGDRDQEDCDLKPVLGK
jgi:hypothetical protein